MTDEVLLDPKVTASEPLTARRPMTTAAERPTGDSENWRKAVVSAGPGRAGAPSAAARPG
jgi:hypothetical protein